MATRYKQFGDQLRQLRTDRRLTITDLGNALETDRSHISKLENGHERPSVDLLNRIISHFSLSRDEAYKLWHASGHPDAELVVTEMVERRSSITVKENTDNHVTDLQAPQNMEVQIQLDREKVPVLYTDSIYLMSNESGLILDFAQSVGPTPQQRVVASIGMSKEQAKKLIQAAKDNLGIE